MNSNTFSVLLAPAYSNYIDADFFGTRGLGFGRASGFVVSVPPLPWRITLKCVDLSPLALDCMTAHVKPKPRAAPSQARSHARGLAPASVQRRLSAVRTLPRDRSLCLLIAC